MDDLERMLEAKTHTPAIDTAKTPAFLVESWRAQLELIEHLCHYSRHVLLVLGPQGAGKTTLLGLFLQKDTPHLLKHKITIEEEEDKESLLAKIKQGFGFSEFPVRAEKANGTLNYVLLVDNAEAASDEVLLNLLKGSIANQPAGFHVLLFAKSSLEHRLIQATFLPYVQGRVHSIEVEPFTFEETKLFLSRWQFQDTAQHGPLDPQEVQALFDHSEGWPGRMLQQIASKRNNTHRKWQHYWREWRERPMWWGLLLVVVLFGAFWMLTVTSTEQKASNRRQQILPAQMGKGLKSSAVSKPTARVEDVVEEKSAAVQSPTVVVEEATTPVLGYAPSPSLLPKVETQVPSASPSAPVANNEVDTAVALETQVALAPAELKVQETKASIELKKEEVIFQKNEPKKKPVVVAQAKIKATTNEHYTVQILGASSERNIKQFMMAHRLKEARYFSTTVKGRPWYVLVYGDFLQKAQAEAALKQLPKDVQAMKPWIRRYENNNFLSVG